MRNVIVKYGITAALVMGALMIVPFWLGGPSKATEGLGLKEVLGYATMVVAMSLVFFAIREYRSAVDRLTFVRGFAVGAGVTLVAALGFGLATVLLYAVLMSPEQIDGFMRAYVEQSAGADSEAVATALQDYEANRHLWQNPWFQGLVMFGTVLPIGLMASTVSALILRSRG